MSDILEIDDLEKSFIKKNKNLIILKDTNYTFKTGKLYTISGRSGSGKTTFINLLGLITKPTKGNILINGKNTNIS